VSFTWFSITIQLPTLRLLLTILNAMLRDHSAWNPELAKKRA